MRPVAVGPSVNLSSTDFSFQNLVFWNWFEFLADINHLKFNIFHILNPNVTKWILLNPAHHDLSNYTKATFQFLWNFQLWLNLILTEEIVQYSRTFASQVWMSWNQAHAPLLVKGFPKTSRTWSEASWLGGSHN